jgi:hypothetical protein
VSFARWPESRLWHTGEVKHGGHRLSLDGLTIPEAAVLDLLAAEVRPSAGQLRQRLAEGLERIFGTAVQLTEVGSVADLVTAIAQRDPVGVALDSAAPGQLVEAVAAAGTLPVLRPLWRRQRNTRGEIDEVFDMAATHREVLASVVTQSGTWPCCGFRPDVPHAVARW